MQGEFNVSGSRPNNNNSSGHSGGTRRIEKGGNRLNIEGDKVVYDPNIIIKEEPLDDEEVVCIFPLRSQDVLVQKVKEEKTGNKRRSTVPSITIPDNSDDCMQVEDNEPTKSLTDVVNISMSFLPPSNNQCIESGSVFRDANSQNWQITNNSTSASGTDPQYLRRLTLRRTFSAMNQISSDKADLQSYISNMTELNRSIKAYSDSNTKNSNELTTPKPGKKRGPKRKYTKRKKANVQATPESFSEIDSICSKSFDTSTSTSFVSTRNESKANEHNLDALSSIGSETLKSLQLTPTTDVDSGNMTDVRAAELLVNMRNGSFPTMASNAVINKSHEELLRFKETQAAVGKTCQATESSGFDFQSLTDSSAFNDVPERTSGQSTNSDANQELFTIENEGTALNTCGHHSPSDSNVFDDIEIICELPNKNVLLPPTGTDRSEEQLKLQESSNGLERSLLSENEGNYMNVGEKDNHHSRKVNASKILENIRNSVEYSSDKNEQINTIDSTCDGSSPPVLYRNDNPISANSSLVTFESLNKSVQFKKPDCESNNDRPQRNQNCVRSTRSTSVKNLNTTRPISANSSLDTLESLNKNIQFKKPDCESNNDRPYTKKNSKRSIRSTSVNKSNTVQEQNGAQISTSTPKKKVTKNRRIKQKPVVKRRSKRIDHSKSLPSPDLMQNGYPDISPVRRVPLNGDSSSSATLKFKVLSTKNKSDPLYLLYQKTDTMGYIFCPQKPIISCLLPERMVLTTRNNSNPDEVNMDSVNNFDTNRFQRSFDPSFTNRTLNISERINKDGQNIFSADSTFPLRSSTRTHLENYHNTPTPNLNKNRTLESNNENKTAKSMNPDGKRSAFKICFLQFRGYEKSGYSIRRITGQSFSCENFDFSYELISPEQAEHLLKVAEFSKPASETETRQSKQFAAPQTGDFASRETFNKHFIAYFWSARSAQNIELEKFAAPRSPFLSPPVPNVVTERSEEVTNDLFLGLSDMQGLDIIRFIILRNCFTFSTHNRSPTSLTIPIIADNETNYLINELSSPEMNFSHNMNSSISTVVPMLEEVSEVLGNVAASNIPSLPTTQMEETPCPTPHDTANGHFDNVPERNVGTDCPITKEKSVALANSSSNDTDGMIINVNGPLIHERNSHSLKNSHNSTNCNEGVSKGIDASANDLHVSDSRQHAEVENYQMRNNCLRNENISSGVDSPEIEFLGFKIPRSNNSISCTSSNYPAFSNTFTAPAINASTDVNVPLRTFPSTSTGNINFPIQSSNCQLNSNFSQRFLPGDTIHPSIPIQLEHAESFGPQDQNEHRLNVQTFQDQPANIVGFNQFSMPRPIVPGRNHVSQKYPDPKAIIYNVSKSLAQDQYRNYDLQASNSTSHLSDMRHRQLSSASAMEPHLIQNMNNDLVYETPNNRSIDHPFRDEHVTHNNFQRSNETQVSYVSLDTTTYNGTHEMQVRSDNVRKQQIVYHERYNGFDHSHTRKEVSGINPIANPNQMSGNYSMISYYDQMNGRKVFLNTSGGNIIRDPDPTHETNMYQLGQQGSNVSITYQLGQQGSNVSIFNDRMSQNNFFYPNNSSFTNSSNPVRNNSLHSNYPMFPRAPSYSYPLVDQYNPTSRNRHRVAVDPNLILSNENCTGFIDNQNNPPMAGENSSSFLEGGQYTNNIPDSTTEAVFRDHLEEAYPSIPIIDESSQSIIDIETPYSEPNSELNDNLFENQECEDSVEIFSGNCNFQDQIEAGDNSKGPLMSAKIDAAIKSKDANSLVLAVLFANNMNDTVSSLRAKAHLAILQREIDTLIDILETETFPDRYIKEMKNLWLLGHFIRDKPTEEIPKSFPAEFKKKHPFPSTLQKKIYVILNQSYDEDTKPKMPRRLHLADIIGWSEKQVNTWFKNRRQRDRKQLEEACGRRPVTRKGGRGRGRGRK